MTDWGCQGADAGLHAGRTQAELALVVLTVKATPLLARFEGLQPA